MATLANLENLLAALDAANRCDLADEAAWTRDYNPTRMESRLFDAALACGMPFDEPSVREWAAARVTRFLCSA